MRSLIFLAEESILYPFHKSNDFLFDYIPKVTVTKNREAIQTAALISSLVKGLVATLLIDFGCPGFSPTIYKLF